ncbi:MAG: hypothetical protein GXX96_36475 [Planctomycetaceae bacterium]|nr:hypothetical protein [Planctomycetaceae bacterium]
MKKTTTGLKELRARLSAQYSETTWTASKKPRPRTFDKLVELVGKEEDKVMDALRLYYPSGKVPVGFWAV